MPLLLTLYIIFLSTILHKSHVCITSRKRKTMGVQCLSQISTPQIYIMMTAMFFRLGDTCTFRFAPLKDLHLPPTCHLSLHLS